MQYKLLYNDARLEIPLFGRYLPTYVPEQQLYTYKLTLYLYVNIITELTYILRKAQWRENIKFTYHDYYNRF